MRGSPAIGIDDDLAAGQPGVAIRTADDEIARRIDQQVIRANHPAIGKNIGDQRGYQLADVRLCGVFGMLCRQHDLVRAGRLAVIAIDKCNLAFRVGAQDGFGIGLPDLGKPLQDLVRIMDRRRHQHICLAAGIAEHESLVAGALILVVAAVDAHRDVGGLFVKIVLEFEMRMMEFILLVADIGHRAAHSALNRVHDAGHLVFRGADLPADDYTVCGCQCLAGHARFRLGRQKQVKDRVGHTVAQLVWMSFGYGFRSEKIGH